MPESKNRQDTFGHSVVKVLKVVVQSIQGHATQPFDASVSVRHTYAGLADKNIENVGYILSNGTRRSGSIFCPPRGSLLNLCEGLRGNSDSQ